MKSDSMNWDSPRYEEIKMDAEIGSYQPDPELPDFVERFSGDLHVGATEASTS